MSAKETHMTMNKVLNRLQDDEQGRRQKKTKHELFLQQEKVIFTSTGLLKGLHLKLFPLFSSYGLTSDHEQELSPFL